MDPPASRGGHLEVPALEGLRLGSALLIVYFHCQLVAAPLRDGGPAGAWMVRSGYLAVDFLFVLSGFAQFLPMAAAGPDRLPRWRDYAKRRVLRIVPAYWLACAATVAYVGSVSLGPGRPGRVVGLWEGLIHLAFLQHLVYGLDGQVGFGPNTALWTMTAEALFYVTLPLVARWFLRHPLLGLGWALAIALSWRAFVILQHGHLALSVNLVSQYPAFAFHFGVGMVAAVVVTRLRSDPGSTDLDDRQLGWIAGSAVLWGALALGAWMRAADPVTTRFDQVAGFYDRWVWNLFPAAAFAILLVGASLAPRWATAPLANPVVRWLGEATYGTYLVHILIMLEIDHAWVGLGHHRPLALWQIGTATAVAALAVGRLSFYLIEEPARRLARRREAPDDRARGRAPARTPSRAGGGSRAA